MKSTQALLIVLVFSFTLLAGCTTTTTEAPAEDAMMEDKMEKEDAMMEDGDSKMMEDDSAMMEDKMEKEDAMMEDGDAMEKEDGAAMEKKDDAMMEADVEAEVTSE